MLVELTPYPWIIWFPTAVMTGQASLAKGFAMQAIWIGIVVTIHRLLWARGLKRFGAAGG
jgi:ABC-type uncharacterized transport system permease subunit